MSGKPLTIIKASAGSGKTYTLAKLFIRQLLFVEHTDGRLTLRRERNYHRHMLAITFTNKATDEMKKRIIDRLYELATNPDESDYYSDFERDLNFKGDKKQAIRDKAREALNDILMNYSLFNVSTIDAFFQNILRTFARELNRSYDYELQINSNYVAAVAVNNFLHSLGITRHRADDRLTDVEQWVQDMIADKMNDGGSWRSVYNGLDLIKLCENLGKEVFMQSIGDIRRYFYPNDDDTLDLSKMRAFKKAIESQINDDALQQTADALRDELVGVLSRHGLTVEDTIRGLKNTCNATNVITGNPGVFLKNDELEVEKCIKKEKFETLTEDVVLALSDDLQRARQHILYNINRYNLLDFIAKHLGTLGLLGVLDREMTKFRLENNTILISDTNELIGRVLDSGVEFMYEHTGGVINHYMIDEFQDTSNKQYYNFKPLLDDSIAGAQSPVDLIIGDSKQSIYRFRNADPELFQTTLESDMRGNCDVLNLDTNFRSLRNIVQFNNALVGKLIAFFGSELSETYHEYEQKVSKAMDDVGQGLVRIVTSPISVLPDDVKINKTIAHKAVLDMLPAYLLDIHRRLGSWSKMGILVNKNDEGKDIVNAIIAHNDGVTRRLGVEDARPYIINVASDEAMLVSNSPAVTIVINMLRLLDITRFASEDDEDNTASADQKETGGLTTQQREQRLCVLLNLFIRRMREENVLPKDAQAVGGVMARCVQEIAGYDDSKIKETINSLLPSGNTEPLTVDAIVENLISRLVLAGNPEHADVTFLLALQDIVADFMRSQGGSIHEFLKYWDANKNNLCVPGGEGADAMQVLTIHKSKGLEFDCVIIPFADWNINGKSNEANYYLWVTKGEWTEQNGKAMLSDVDLNTLPPLIPVRTDLLRKINQLSGNNPTLSGMLSQYDHNVLIDLMNKTYVALTRPRHELHLFTLDLLTTGQPENLDMTKSQSVATLINHAVPRLDLPGLRQVEQNDIKSMRDLYAELKELEQDGEQPDTTQAQLADVATLNWWTLGDDKIKDKPNNEEVYQPLEITARDLQAKEPRVEVMLPKGDNGDSRRTIGLIVHRAMMLINYRGDEKRAANAVAGDLATLPPDSPMDANALSQLLSRMVNNPPQTARWHNDLKRDVRDVPSNAIHWWDDDNEVLNERSIVKNNPDKDEVVVRRPDRVICRPDGTVIVVDFKTGSERPQKHLRQIKEYAELLDQAMRPPRLEAYLWYLDNDELVRVL